MSDRNNQAMLFLTGAALGAGVTYVFDPTQGRRRRKLAVDKLVSSTYTVQDAADATRRDLQNRAHGWKARMLSPFRLDEVDDVVLEERVRSHLGRVTSHPGAIDVKAQEGWVTLRGDTFAGQAEHITRSVQRVRGVRGVDNQLREHEDTSNIPSLQGGGSAPGEPIELAKEYWGPAPRLFVGLAGAGVATVAMSRWGWKGLPVVMAGVLVVLRAMTNMSFQRLLGLGGRRGIDLHKTIHVRAPLEDVYQFWRNFETFPRFMDHVRAVHTMDGRRSHWTVDGIAGTPVAFDVEITTQKENHTLGWRTIGRTPFRHAGVVRFQDDGDNGTRVDIQMTYNPPLGLLGHALATFLRTNPRQQLEDDLVRFKSLMEEGRTTAHGEEVSREEVAAAVGMGHPGDEQW